MINLPNTDPGMVYLVGAGPGDPGLLTLRAVECMQLAEVILYDYLVNPEVLKHASPSAELVPLGRPHSGRKYSPEEIVEQMLHEARAGRTVVRLKGGDPSVFGRCADETQALRDANVPYEIVPGITAGLAVAAYCEIPLTQQDDASAVALVTGRERNCKEVSCVDYDSLGCFRGTLVFYMAVGRAKLWTQALMDRGKSPDMPVGIVQWCSRDHQSFLRCTLGTVLETIEREEVRPPAVFVVGDVVDRAPPESWFARKQAAALDGASHASSTAKESLVSTGRG